VPSGSVLIELGTGSADKAIELLRHLSGPQAYRPIDISRDALARTTEAVRATYPKLAVSPYWGDFAADAAYADLPSRAPRLIYYSGSTIGNFEPAEAVAFLRSLHERLRRGDVLLLAADLVKDPAVIHEAYNDAGGITAAFNRNALSALNRRFGANFESDAFAHLAFYNGAKHRVEMHLVPERRMEVTIAGRQLWFDPAEPIHTESSYKFTREGLHSLAAHSGFTVGDLITDERDWFAEALLCA
jgi:dimethylhistidine N-methyltransferase